MRIRGISDTSQYFNRVNERSDSGRSGQDQRQKNDDKQEKEKEDLTPEDLDRALAAFDADQQAHSSGISASSIGNGPGLRVVLKDGSGAVIRQMTGEEFVRLRDTVSKDGHASGKLLDQKL